MPPPKIQVKYDAWAALSVTPISVGPLEVRASDLRRVVVLSPLMFRLCWWIVFIYHMLNAFFALICGAAHRILARPSVYQSTWMLAIPQGTLTVAGWCYIAVAVVHLYSLTLNLWQSIVQRKLTFRFDSSRKKGKRKICLGNKLAPRIATALSSPFRPVNRLWNRFFGVSGLFGPQGRYFEASFHMQLLMDIAAQVYQAYVISWSVPHESINNVFVTMIVMYCIKTPVIDYALRQKPAQCRLVNLIVDVVLDFGIGVVIPMWVLYPTLRDFDMALGRFPQRLTYNDEWVANMMSEGRVVLVTSAADCVTSLIPHVMGLVAISSIKEILRCASASVDVSESLVITLGSLEAPSFRVRASIVGFALRVRRLRSQRIRRQLSLFFQSKSAISWMNALTIVIAIVTSILHAQARLGGDRNVSTCDIRVNAWLATKYPCSIAQINCYQLSIAGHLEDVHKELSLLERSMLTRIVFSHCDRLHVPPIVTEFKNLRAFEIFNSTIVQWEEDAALTRSRQPRIVHILLVRSNIATTVDGCPGCLPQGILHDNLPMDLNLVIHRSNVSAFPENIGELWGGGKVRWITFWIEHTSLSELPASFSSLHLVKLSLVGNQLKQLPDDLLSGPTKHLTMLRVSENPLEKLPSELSDKATLVHLFVDKTNVSVVPPWVSEWMVTRNALQRRHVVSFAQSPVCCSSSAVEGTSTTWECPTPSQEVCQVVDPVLREDFRLDLIQTQRPL